MLQYKPSSGSDNDWTTLMSYYNDQALYDQAVKNGMNAEMIKAADAAPSSIAGLWTTCRISATTCAP